MLDNLANNNVAGAKISGRSSIISAEQKREQAEDIFAKAKVSAKPEIFRPKMSESERVGLSEREKKSSGFKTIAVWAAVAVGLALLGVVGYFLIKKQQQQFKTTESEHQGGFDLKNSNSAGIKAETSEIFIKPIPADSDQDGLSDNEELKIGSDANLIDSDGDGLFDREEVVVYKTNPNNSDTDGDGFSDEEEVKKGYNPKGAGKLYEIR